MTAKSTEVTRVTEDYLSLIWKACEWPDDGRHPNTTDLAASLGVTLSTVSANLKRLAREGMINYRPYGNIELTEAGEVIGREVVRRHRIIETYLVEKLNFPWDEVHAEADSLEHAASEKLIEHMDEVLGRPSIDPHGDPIPRADFIPQNTVTLSNTQVDTEVKIARVSDSNPDILRFLTSNQLHIGATLTIVRAMSGTGLMTVKHNETPLELSTPIADAIQVTENPIG